MTCRLCGTGCTFYRNTAKARLAQMATPSAVAFYPPFLCRVACGPVVGSPLHKTTPLRLGKRIERQSTIASVKHKAGRSGDLLFVLVKHALHNADGIAVTEEHDIVYRAAAQASDPVPEPTMAPTDSVWHREITPDDVLLFRYSALTFNGHRIHYDRRYVTEVEGYPGLIVHGPLIATYLVDLVRRHAAGAWIAGFEFKAVRPTFDLHHFQVHAKPSADGKTVHVWANDHDGYLTMNGEVRLSNTPA